jgi:hypothetical protein
MGLVPSVAIVLKMLQSCEKPVAAAVTGARRLTGKEAAKVTLHTHHEPIAPPGAPWPTLAETGEGLQFPNHLALIPFASLVSARVTRARLICLRSGLPWRTAMA